MVKTTYHYKKCKSKPLQDNHFTPTKRAIIKKTDSKKYYQCCGEIAGGNENKII